MRKYLVMEALKKKFFNDKDEVINDYLAKCCEGGTQVLEYTNGKKAIATLYTHKVYSRNGFFFSVILQDEYYLNSLDEEALLDELNEYYSNTPIDNSEEE